MFSNFALPKQNRNHNDPATRDAYKNPFNIKQEIIFVLGGPGSGKGTHCRRLEEAKGYHHISTGDLVRNIITDNEGAEDEHPEIKNIRQAVRRGELLDDHMVTDLLKHEMALYPRAAGFLIDGFPRTLEQLHLFESQIKPCSKVLYFDTTEEIMKQRILKRGQEENREDDNEITAARRIKVYKEKTMPVVNYLEANKAAIFNRIDSRGPIEEVSKLVDDIMKTNPIEQVSYLEFLYLYLTCGNFYDAVDELQNRHGGAADFEVTLAYVTMFYIIQNKEDVKRILCAKTESGYQNQNFEAAHGHDLNINATQAFTKDPGKERNPLWDEIHKGLAASTGNIQQIDALIKKHITKLFAKPQFMLDVAFEDFMLDFWCEYMFGPKVNSNEYKATRTKMLAALRYAFYGNSLKSIPYLGNLTCRLYGYLESDEFKQVDAELKKYINQADGGLLLRFKKELEKSAKFPADKIEQAVLDNAFDFVLVFDFIHNAMYETLAEVIRRNLDTTSQRKRAFAQGLVNAFLFPVRVRIPQEEIELQSTTLKAGVPTYINLVKSGLYNSYGPRSCVGILVTDWIKESIWRQFEGMQLRVVKENNVPERESFAYNRDVPVSPERYEVKWQYPKNYLQKTLPVYEFKGLKKFYDVLKIYENPRLIGYIVSSFLAEIAKQKIDKENMCVVTPELRGVPAAAMVAKELQVPLVIIRKKGKIPGDKLQSKYFNAYSSDELEISVTSDVAGKEVVLIDDGIASGNTIVACCQLIEKLGGKVRLVQAVIDHHYMQKPKELERYTVQTLFDFKAEALAQPVNDADVLARSPNVSAKM